MLRKKNRLVIDTNLWISFLLSDSFIKIESHLQKNNTTLVFSEELLEEFLVVVQRPKLAKYFSPDKLYSLLENIQLYAEFIDVVSKIDICRDANDNFLLALAKDGKATHLLTGDRDLLVLEKFGKVKIMTLTDYLS